MQTTERAHIAINDAGFLLAHGQDIGELKGRIESTVRDGGGFVDFVVQGDSTVSVFLSHASHIVISVETVVDDGGDPDDDASAFGGPFDLI